MSNAMLVIEGTRSGTRAFDHWDLTHQNSWGFVARRGPSHSNRRHLVRGRLLSARRRPPTRSVGSSSRAASDLTRINAGDLADQLQVSRTPILDALVLRNEGDGRDPASQGSVRAAYSQAGGRRDLQHQGGDRDTRRSLGSRARNGEAKQQRAAALIEDFRAAAGKHDVLTSARRVEELHLRLFSMADSKVLSDVYRVLHGRVKLLRHLNMAQPGRLEVWLAGAHGDCPAGGGRRRREGL